MITKQARDERKTNSTGTPGAGRHRQFIEVSVGPGQAGGTGTGEFSLAGNFASGLSQTNKKTSTPGVLSQKTGRLILGGSRPPDPLVGDGSLPE